MLLVRDRSVSVTSMCQSVCFQAKLASVSCLKYTFPCRSCFIAALLVFARWSPRTHVYTHGQSSFVPLLPQTVNFPRAHVFICSQTSSHCGSHCLTDLIVACRKDSQFTKSQYNKRNCKKCLQKLTSIVFFNRHETHTCNFLNSTDRHFAKESTEKYNNFKFCRQNGV